MLWLFWSLLAFDSGIVKYSETEFFQPLRKSDIAVGPRGDVYVLHYAEAKVLHYAPDGTPLPAISQKGQGPGELSFPMSITFQDGKLFVPDRGSDSIKIFDPDGKIIESVRMPNGAELAKTRGGWAIGKWGGALSPDTRASISWSDESLANNLTVYEWDNSQDGGRVEVRRTPGGSMEFPYNPATDRSFMVGSPGGSLVFLSTPGPFKIVVFDMDQKKLVGTVERSEQAARFNEDWGLKRIGELNETNKAKGAPIKFVPNFPEYFPLIRDMYVSQEGQLVIEKWSVSPDRVNDILVLDRHGNPAKLPYDPRHEGRVAAILDGNAYVTLFDAEADQAEVARVPMTEVDAFLNENPIEFEGFTGRLMVRSQ